MVTDGKFFLTIVDYMNSQANRAYAGCLRNAPDALMFRAIGRISRKSRRQGAALAQLVEHRIRNAGVGCSSHPGGTTFPRQNFMFSFIPIGPTIHPGFQRGACG